MRELVIAVAWAFVITGVVAGCVLLFSIAFESGQCATLSRMSELRYEWVFWGGCLVQIPNGAWISADDAPQWMLLEMGDK